MYLHSLLAVICFALCSVASQAQRVAVVLSGGGSNGLAHVGVLRALEEDSIPIDFIAGTSMGAIVGGLYAAGYSPVTIEQLLTDEDFINDIQGELNEKSVYYFRKGYPDASMGHIRFSKNSPITSALPTGVVYPAGLDYRLMEVCAGANAVSDEVFSNLFVPFRCVAADIADKKTVVFFHGQLNKAIRASATYPFYYKPVLTDGKILFDGGLYNNFPVDIAISAFNPDYIIGSNVSYNYDPPEIDDLLSQLKNMLVKATDYSLKGKDGVLIEPLLTGSAFEYSDLQSRIEAGYEAAKFKIAEIKTQLHRRADPSDVELKRKTFNDRKPPLVFESFDVRGLSPSQSYYVRKSLSSGLQALTADVVRDRFNKLLQDENIKYAYPGVHYNPQTKKYALELEVEKEKDFQINVGGNVSSKPINTGFIGLKYNFLQTSSYELEVNSYFGKYYGSLMAAGRLTSGWRIPIEVEASYCLNRSDYFRAKTSFFELVKPTYILFEENYGTLRFSAPVGYKSKLSADFKSFRQEGQYYLTDAFLSTDTADVTRFSGFTSGLRFERSTLNRKQWASAGDYWSLQLRWFNGTETTTPGSTSLSDRISRQNQDWIQLALSHQNFFKTVRYIKLGYSADLVLNSQYVFSNYQANLIFNTPFQPIPESKTLFLSNFRANKFIALGFQTVFELKKNLDLRASAYLFQPVNALLINDGQRTEFGSLLGQRFNIFSGAVVYHSPIGPVSMALNYYEREKYPLSFVLNFGYILFNKGVSD